MNKDWFSQLEERRASVLLALVLITVAILAVASLRDPMSYDSFWHLKMGEDWIERGLSPFADHYSFTHYGEEISAPPYLFQALYYKSVDLLGLDAGYKVLFFVALLLTTIMLLVWLRFVRAPTVIYLVALPLLLYLLFLRGNLRPELFAYPLMILSLILYERARIDPSNKNFLAIAATMLLFTNYHAAILGYVIFFGLFVDLAIDQFRNHAPSSRWLRWGAWGAVIVAVGFANPDLSHPVILALSFSEEWRSLILEYRSPWSHDPVVAALLLVFWAATVVMLWRQRLFGYIVVSLVFAWQASQAQRMVAPAGIIILCLFILALSRLDLHGLLTRGSQPRRALVAGVWGVLFIVPLLASVSEARARVKSNPSLLGYFPDQLVEYMKDQGMQGRVFNDYALGGYFIYHLAPEVQVYIDGRTGILYPVERHRRWLQASTQAEALMSEIDEYDIDYVALSNRPEHVDLMGNVPNMYLDYADLRFSLYAEENANFPVSGALWSTPACWGHGNVEQLKAERTRARFLLPGYSPLFPILDLAAGYAGSDDRIAFLQGLLGREPDSWSDPTIRIAGYRALELGEFDTALKFFSKLREPLLVDYLAVALANLRLELFDEAEQALQGAFRLGGAGTSPREFIVIHGLLNELQDSRPLQRIPQSTLDELTLMAEQQGIPLEPGTVSPDWFCDREG